MAGEVTMRREKFLREMMRTFVMNGKKHELQHKFPMQKARARAPITLSPILIAVPSER